MVEILARVGSCEEDACDKKSDGCNGAAEFWKTCSSGMNGCHVEKPSWFLSNRPEIWLGSVSLSFSKVSKLEITEFHSEKAVCENGNLSPKLLNLVGLQKLLSLSKSSLSSVSSSSSSEK